MAEGLNLGVMEGMMEGIQSMPDEILHLMIIDDEPGMRDAVERTLTGFVHQAKDSTASVGFRISQAASAEQALQLFEQAKPDILLLDHGLPGVSGISLLQTIRNDIPEILVIMITAYGTLENAVRATKLGAFDFLAKPFTPDEVRSAVCKAVDHIVLQRQSRRIADERRKIRFEFLTSIVHELKTPLAAVEGYLRLLQEPEPESGGMDRQYMIERSLKRLEGMRTLIYDLLDLTRIESGQKKRLLTQVDITRIAERVCTDIVPAAEALQVTVALESSAPVGMLADAEEVQIMISNLVTNAVKYNRPGGSVTISCKRRDDRVAITVSDTGIGMSSTELGSLSGEFSRIHNSRTAGIPGSGLGLSIVRSLATRYEGTLDIASEADIGSTFTITLLDRKTFVDNEYYDREATDWWSGTDNPLMIIRYMMNPVRFSYVLRHLVAQSYDYRYKRVLDIGCGGGFLTEEIAKYGFETTGLDPSSPTLVTARSHARIQNLQIDYLEGVGEALLFPDNHFDIVFCLDVLEHVSDFRKIISEVSRVLAPGGLFFFETVNRTPLSYFIVIFLMQIFPLTRMIPKDVHNWKYFIKPKELQQALKATNLRVEDITGILPGFGMLYHLPQLRSMASKRLSVRELCAIFRCRESSVKALCYVGYAKKAGGKVPADTVVNIEAMAGTVSSGGS
jgi:ubiquinone biosynthesis O-methyltransferase